MFIKRIVFSDENCQFSVSPFFCSYDNIFHKWMVIGMEIGQNYFFVAFLGSAHLFWK